MPCPARLPEDLTRLIPRMTRMARHLTGNRDEAQDLCQEVLLKLLCRMRDGRTIDNLEAYAMTALRNEYRQVLRVRQVTDDLDEVTLGVAPEVFGLMALRETLKAIERLPDDQGGLMRMVVAGETSPQALARATGLPVGTVMSRLARARNRLRDDLELSPEDAGAPQPELTGRRLG